MKKCQSCGTVVEDTTLLCPNCKAVITSAEEPDNGNPFATLTTFGHKEVKKKLDDYNPLKDNKRFNSAPPPTPEPPVPEFFSKKKSSSSKSSSSKNKVDDSTIKIGIIIGAVVLIIIVSIVIINISLNKDNDKNKVQDGEINLTKPDDTVPPKEPEPDPTPNPDPTPDPDPNPEPNPNPNPNPDPKPPVEEPQYFEKKIGEYTFTIPKKYTVTEYQGGIGLTITDTKNGTTMTMVPGVYSLKTYRAKKDELVLQMEENGTVVNKVYDTTYNNNETQVLELTQMEGSYIMAIVAVPDSEDTFIIIATDLKDLTNFNYNILTDAMNIFKTIKKK